MMNDWILFMLSTTGMVFILVKSRLFCKVRCNITTKHEELKKDIALYRTDPENENYKSTRLTFWWFIDSIMNCDMCMSIWAAIVCYTLLYCKIYPVLWLLSIVGPVSLLGALYNLWKRH